MRLRLVCPILALSLFCSTAALADFIPGRIRPAPVAIPAPLGRISVRDASVLRAVYPIPTSVQRLLPQWRTALREAVVHAGVFAGGPGPALDLSARILEFARSGETLIVFVRYQLAPEASPAPLFSADILSDAGVTSIDSNSIVDRSSIVGNRSRVAAAVTANISQFIAQLEDFINRGGLARAGTGRYRRSAVPAHNRVESQIATREPALMTAHSAS